MVGTLIRNALVLSVAALGVQYVRTVRRVLEADSRPEHEQPDAIPTPLFVLRGTTRSGLQVVNPTLDTHGAR
jgi:hypothetical protein